MSSEQPSEEELRAALDEQMRRITVQDVLIQTVVTLINLGGRRLGLAGPPEEAGAVDLEQARLAIEGARGLAPLLPQDQLGPVRDALSQLQMAYVQLTQGEQRTEGETGAEAPPSGESPEPPAEPPKPGADDEEARAKARSKIWTPPGS